MRKKGKQLKDIEERLQRKSKSTFSAINNTKRKNTMAEEEKRFIAEAEESEVKMRKLIRTASNEGKKVLMELLDLKTVNKKDNNNKESVHRVPSLSLIERGSRKLAVSVFNVILTNWMYSFGKEYTRSDFMLLFNRISDLVVKDLPLRFFLPGFPCKSANKEKKVLGNAPDFSEFLALRLLLTTARKLEAIYPHGVIITIMSDYHTFDEYIGVTEEQYKIYHEGLKSMINGIGADDVIELISLQSFPEFKDVPLQDISRVLSEKYGGKQYLTNFDVATEVAEVLEKYVKMKKFMLEDQSHNLPGSPRANRTKKFIRDVARGMMSQGVALDQFLKTQSYLKDYIRLSIHHHHPMTGKFAIDLFKDHSTNSGILRTPWHHTVLFDTENGEFFIDQKISILKAVAVEGDSGSALVTVQFEDRDWFYLNVYFSEEYAAMKEELSFEAQMIKGGCGIILTNKTVDAKGNTKPIKSDCISPESLTAMIKEFGLVVLRGFEDFKDEDAMIEFYKKRADHGIVHWDFGPIHKVMPSDDMPGYVNSYDGIPIHFDFVAPPRYMAISQAEHRYEDFICREFLLYCRENPAHGTGGTTFIDAHGAVLALSGSKKEEWKKTVLAYETKLKMVQNNKEVYFGGSGNVYEYPLIQACPWTGKDVLRWWESWTEYEHPNSTQHNWSKIQSSSTYNKEHVSDLEKEIRKIAFDERFFFAHNYEQGDQVFVNNYTTLHGRAGFASKRELWRIQAIPPSDNLPAYFK